MVKFFSLTLALLLIPHFSFAADPLSNTPTKVGLLLPLTGPLAEYGTAFQNGVTLARRDSPAIDAHCSFSVEDSKYDPKTAVGAFQKLSSTQAVSIIYNWGGPTSDAVSPLADRSDVALFVWSADPKVAEGHKQVIRFSNSGGDYGGTLAKYLAGRGYKKLGVVRTENQYIDAILSGLTAAPQNLNVEVVDAYQPGDQDFRPTITKLKTRSYDALGIFMLSGQVAQFVNQMQTQKVHFPIFGTDFFESMTEVEQSHGGLVGAVFSNNEVLPTFRESYVSTFKNDLQINHAANGYDFAVFLCQKLGAELPKLSPAELIKRASSETPFAGTQGKAEFTASPKGDKYFKFPVVMRLIEEGRISTISEGKS